MLSLGSLLIRPERIQKAAAAPLQTAFVDDLVSLVSRLALDRSQGEAVLHALEEAFAALAQRMAAGMDPQGLQTAVEAWLKPFLDGAQAFAQAPPAIESPTDLLEWASGKIDWVVEVLKALNITTLSAKLAELITLLETRMGLSKDGLDAYVWSVVDDVTTRLEAPAASAGTTGQQCALLLKKLKREAQGSFHIALPSADTMAKTILDQLRAGGMDVFTKHAAQVAGDLQNILDAAQGLSAVAGVSGFGAASVGAAQAAATPNQGDTYCWYASWLLQSRTRPTAYSFFDWLPGCPYDEVWVTADATQVVQRNPFRDDIVLHTGANVKWHDAPLFKKDTPGDHYTFRDGLTPDFMEQFAQATACLVEGIKWLLHIIGATEKGNSVVHALLSGWALSNTMTYGIGGKPPMTWLNAHLHGPQWPRWFFEPMFPLAITLLGSMEGMHTQADQDGSKFWVILLAGDVLEGMKLDAIPYAVREFFLSMFTAINYKGPFAAPSGADTRPLNYLHMDGFTTPAMTLANWILLKLIPRERYSHPFDERGDEQPLTMWLYWNLFGTMVSGITGTAMAIALWLPFARTFSWELLGKQLLKNFLKSLFMFWPSLYGFREGDTGGGEYNPRGNAFRGYPDNASSPYKLPYEKDQAAMCVQGNQGMWSHNNFAGTAQIYAYDFGLDQDELILASRSGTVVDFFDWVPNDTHPSANQSAPADTGGDYAAHQTTAETWNFVLIRHDNPFPDGDENHETADQRNVHDRGPDGTVLTTYAVYGHGRTGSVRELLMAAGQKPKDIIGKHIKRGQPIMRCGNTGLSFHNHLHMDVRYTASGFTEPSSSSDGIALASMTDMTIPFVFADVSNIIGQDGVCKALAFYTSNNEKKDA